ncbi:YolD-like family protein [Lysinibacillus fusiformis]|uniref:YolD-like family protein n=1 Tax=Lysinibacillus fusiformis TaxID=28031 RepID=UPI0035BF74C1|nr:YolD-like family protein [Lysinibacillus fusiformis]
MAKTKTPTKKKEPKHPDRDEFDLEEIANTLTETMQENKIKTFAIYKWEKQLTGTITKMDANTKLIYIKDKYMNIHKVHFLDILKISDIDY